MRQYERIFQIEAVLSGSLNYEYRLQKWGPIMIEMRPAYKNVK